MIDETSRANRCTIISDNIKKCRNKLFPGYGGTKECAKLFGVSPSQWSHWENARRMPGKNARHMLAKFFNIPESDLVRPDFTEEAVTLNENWKGASSSDAPKNETRDDLMSANKSGAEQKPFMDFFDNITTLIAEQITTKVMKQITPIIIKEN